MRLIIFLTLLILSSCTSVHYVDSSGGQVRIASPNVAKKIRVDYKINKTFVLWGKYPIDGHKIDLSDDIFKNNAYEVGNLTIVQSQSTLDKVISFLSLGIVIPYTFQVQGWGEVVDENNQ